MRYVTYTNYGAMPLAEQLKRIYPGAADYADKAAAEFEARQRASREPVSYEEFIWVRNRLRELGGAL